MGLKVLSRFMKKVVGWGGISGYLVHNGGCWGVESLV